MNLRSLLRKMNLRGLVACAALLCLGSIFNPDARGAEFEVQDSVLVIPSGVTRIPAHAFADRTDFHSVRFEAPASLTSIGDYAFLGCRSLREITFPPKVASIGQGAFRECGSLRRVMLPSRMTVIPRYAFAWCGNLEEVTGTERVADIQAHAFAYCSALQSFEFGRALTHVGSNAFSFCSSLTRVSLPASVKELESYAFSECVSLREAVLPPNSHLLGELIFSGCRSLESVTVLSPVPPKFDCNSTLFEETEPQMYEQCRLTVAPGKATLYRTAPGWRLFKEIDQ